MGARKSGLMGYDRIMGGRIMKQEGTLMGADECLKI
jgi:hypothetical protein